MNPSTQLQSTGSPDTISFRAVFLWEKEIIMHTVNSLASVNESVKISEISLELLLNYYEFSLTPYIFKYEVEGMPTIELTFPPAQFCHLLAIEKIMTANRKNFKNAREYRGLLGYEKIKNCSITLETLKKPPYNEQFGRNKRKFTNFHLIPNLLEQPELIKFDGSKVNPSTEIRADIVFYNQITNYYLHLGIIKTKEEGNKFVAKSFFVHSKSGTSDGNKFIVNQEKIIITKIIKEKIEIQI
ncbi:PBECR4 domain-containing protein [Brevibacillus laterosporus]|uniref:PBECR4 domain-containing protein n=1 Tax=Brevibacillus laterosporus TaxID=1465 RepID=UPI0013C4F7C9|nr:PBECR4 domain-containing protein [Brevibacillus laterosporus]